MAHPLANYAQDILVRMYNLEESTNPEEVQERAALEFVHDLCWQVMDGKITLLHALEKKKAYGNTLDIMTHPVEVVVLQRAYHKLLQFVPQETWDILWKPFAITSVCREDLCSDNLPNKLTYEQALAIDDTTLEHIASKMADVYIDNGFWDSLDVYLEDIKENL